MLITFRPSLSTAGGAAEPVQAMHDQFVSLPQEFQDVLQLGAALAGSAGAGLGAYDLTARLTELGFLDVEILA